MCDEERVQPTDYKYEAYGEPESWTWEGMKVYHYSWEISQDLCFIETFCTEDGTDWMKCTEHKDWTNRMRVLAVKGNYI